ncbi:hypothetical protein CA85_31570 [Allorhodopirellula solitaria]|uniref:BBP7 family outer membrane beta-barrel protein n=2 Tax=Allorhodopirellula solitaria TaxID=2527987 RepID=A0A5C5XTA9_9BACT|nr:hypothetical protein CA85_31570 [Allorhodopirellula solitaria]
MRNTAKSPMPAKSLMFSLTVMMLCSWGIAIEAVQADAPMTRAQAMQTTEPMNWRPVSAAECAASPQQDGYLEFGESYEALPDLGPIPMDACDQYGSCDGLAPCGPGLQPGEFWVRAEYLYWSLDAIDLPALVTSSPAGTLPGSTGVLGQPGTSVLFGGSSYGDSYRSGARVTIGWDDAASGNGWQASAMGIFDDDESFFRSSGLLARPVFDTGTSSEASMIVAHPDYLDGSVSISVGNKMQLYDINRRLCLAASQCQNVDFLVGYRHGQLDEMLQVSQSSVYTEPQGQIIPGTTVDLYDHFSAENRFNGAQLGVQFQRHSASTTLSWIAKIGLGVNQAEATIAGRTVNTVPGGGSATFDGGLLAQTSNIGVYEESNFAVLPEVGVNLHTHMDEHLEVFIGYSLLYWSDAVRVSGQVNRNVSQFPPEPITGSGDPSYQFQTDSLLAHGLNVGGAFTF